MSTHRDTSTTTIRFAALFAVLLLISLTAGATRAEAAVTAAVGGNQLVVTGDGADDRVTLRVAVGLTHIQVLDGTTVVGSFQSASFNSIIINAVGGNDTIVFTTNVFGVITKPAIVNGGLGDDSITGGGGVDILHGGEGNDRIFWNFGDGDDDIQGGGGFDTLEFNAADAAERVTLAGTGVGSNAVLTRFNVSGSSAANNVSLTLIERLNVNLRGGNDVFGGDQNLTTLQLTVDGGDGDDAIEGTGGNDTLTGSTGNDLVAGRGGSDIVFGEAGDDRFLWRTDDSGVDVASGGDGLDSAFFGGRESADDQLTITPRGTRAVIIRDAMNELELDRIEKIRVSTSAGADTITATDGLAAVGITEILFEGDEGNDTITGGDTNDLINGGAGHDVLDGGAGDDFIDTGGDDDVVVGGPGNDLFQASRAGNSSFEGGAGIDRLMFLGAAEGELVTVYRNEPGFLVEHASDANPPLIAYTLLANAIEELSVEAFDGDDRIVINPGLANLVAIMIAAGNGADIISTAASSVIDVHGGDQADTLEFDALNQPVSVSSSTISAGGVTRVTHRSIEDVRFQKLLGSLPTIAITSPTSDPTATARSPFIVLAGTAADAEGVASVSFASDRGGSGSAAGTTAWTAAHVPLAAGANVVTATVRDAAGNEASDVITVNVDAFTYTMAEGATGSFFDTDILLANPNSVAAPVSITYLRGDGATVNQTLTLAPTSRTTIRVDQIATLENTEVSATVTSTAALPIVVERTMRWDASGYGAHTDKATEGPSTKWFFAEGSQGFFDTYVLLANASPVQNTATVTFLLESGAQVVKQFTLAPTSRHTVQANAIPEIANQSFGIVVTFTSPGVAERAMYFGAPLFNAGHESAGVNAPSMSWFLAEGATGSFFTTFVLLANPGTADATATVTFLPDNGQPVTKTKAVPAGQRVTLNIAAEDASLASSAVATAVQSTQPILVERAQYWPFTPDRWVEAHNAFGSTAVGTKWGLAEGRVGGPEGYQTFILLANAHVSDAAQVRITFLRADGTTVVTSVTVNATSRLNVQVNSLPELANESFGALIEVTSGPGIFVERALYSDANGTVFAAGTNALATRLP